MMWKDAHNILLSIKKKSKQVEEQHTQYLSIKIYIHALTKNLEEYKLTCTMIAEKWVWESGE